MPPDRNPVSLIKFDGVTGENWTASEKFEVNRAAAKIAQRLAETYNYYMLNLPPEFSVQIGELIYLFDCGPDKRALRPSEAFLYFYEGRVWFHKTGTDLDPDGTAFGQWMGTDNKIEVYTDIYEINKDGSRGASKIPRENNGYKWATHELGHGFEYKVNVILGTDRVRNLLGEDESIDRRGADNNQRTYGFYDTRWGWQQSIVYFKEDGSPVIRTNTGEEFADMFLGWNYNKWEEDVDNIDYNVGQARKNFMERNMAQWIALVINRNRQDTQ